MYRQGLGDCFLLTFPKPEGGDFYILIDCGVILGTPDADRLMKAVVADIAATTKRLDVLVATHEHWDHVSGFDPSKDLFKDFDIGEVWLAWTEDPNDAIANRLRNERNQKLAALWLGVGAMRSSRAPAPTRRLVRPWKAPGRCCRFSASTRTNRPQPAASAPPRRAEGRPGQR